MDEFSHFGSDYSRLESDNVVISSPSVVLPGVDCDTGEVDDSILSRVMEKLLF